MRATNSSDSLVIPSGRTRPADYDACDVRVQVHNTRQQTAAMQSPIGGIPYVGGREVCACAFYSQGQKVGHEVAVRG